jgi:5-methylcytosine-specific restriction endonuclease McrA
VDHIVPCIKPAEGWQGWDKYIESRFVFSAAKLQGLCRECHKMKSKEENTKRRAVKRLNSKEHE